jgi:serine O-acetyltransferase
MLDDLRLDVRHLLKAPTEAGRAGWFRAILDYGIQALIAYRLGRWIREAPRHPVRWIPAVLLAPLYVLLAAWIRLAYDIRFEPSARIGPGLKVFHFGGIRLSGCSLGEHCVIHQEVRVEPATAGGPGPQVGNRVWIGPHARIVGPVRVGDGVTVAAGALVNRDVMAHALVVGSPARVVDACHDNSRFI